MKFVRCLLLMSIAVSTASCATSGSYCEIAKTLHPSRSDVLTQKTKEQLLEHNLTYERVCNE